ncbi:Fe(2+) transporter permease subunit FeoB [Acidithiobacillus sp.]|jgi:ferrous iron transport protein B|uniref:Fe(2+) transporter permease subunit FeoB n=1 Tax=Acidithiobacillus sp. TaxID=1872118 RepID=UPI0025B86A9B|nr:Fe(2+) transporter permease subunit FeoB [Acidithiobacillus sp.]MCK9189547.1 Fe(2+) transporter permease subunit FeoB [Acidithiobacillus sp.]MCK9359130.1 Fe(2+) transporter permease subunit FeoB [Acidithiobacillus sp.]
MSTCHEENQKIQFTAGLPVIALAGNPNCGKTTLFNLLTGAHQHIGNWPGVTVERRSGNLSLAGRKVSVVDLPGVYSLLGGGGEDQTVARDFLLDGQVDLIVNIVDASNLARHLALTAELLEIGRPMVLVMNMVDEAEAQGLEVHTTELSAALGLPVVPMIARKGRGRSELLGSLTQTLKQAPHGTPPAYGLLIERALNVLTILLPGGNPARRRFEALRLLEGSAEPADPGMQYALQQIIAEVEDGSTEIPADLIMDRRFGWAQEMAAMALRRNGNAGMRQRVTDLLDRVVLNDWLGVPVFLLMLYLVFVVSFSGGNVFLDFFDQASAAILIHGVGHVLLETGLPTWLISVAAGGVGGGLNLVISFIPPIGLTFLFLAFLDDSGYMARAAYAMDRLMRRLGLPGSALVPMVIGFGCNVPAIMGSRIIEDPRGRILTVLMQPFMSCSARLTIYMAFAVVFFRNNGGQVVFALYVLGIIVALLTAWLLGKTAMRGEVLPFVMELPPYRLPSFRSVFLQSWQRLKVFIFRVGRVIAVIGVVLFILPGIGWTDHGLRSTNINHSLLAQGSRALVPIFEPMGIHQDNWPAISGLVAGAAAKEIVIGTLNGIYQRQNAADLLADYRDPDIAGQLWDALNTIPANAVTFITTLDDPLGLSAMESTFSAEQASGAESATLQAIAAGFTTLSAFTYLVFVLLYVPCASTMGALRREVGWRWMIFSLLYGTGLAWGASTVIYQTGTFAEHPGSSTAWIAGVLAAFALLVIGLRLYGQRSDMLSKPFLNRRASV